MKPDYFERIRLAAAKRWDQLDGDPELAGPWHQLFKQVQSPRHVLSELLQNADDAGATEADVEIVGDDFLFTHDGEDFTADHFASLCRFGYSNKRALHTTGFRGIGFKSTFSIGDEVRLQTPTLSVLFRKRHFSEPVWQHPAGPSIDGTRVSVRIRDEHCRTELERNLDDWVASPVSLLFFKNIRRLTIRGHDIHWQRLGDGPCEGSSWMGLPGVSDSRFLLIRSGEEEFPEEALTEIRQERLVQDDEMAFPPCKVDLVLGAEGRLFVVLPTGVRTSLPFACNAPFVQDPARVKIKDPETSFTNRWLLNRVGALAARGMLAWLANENLHPEERAAAYDLFVPPDDAGNTIEGVCAAEIAAAFNAEIAGHEYLLTESGTSVKKLACVSYPPEILEIWHTPQATKLFDAAHRPPLSHDVSPANRAKLIGGGHVEVRDKAHVISVLESTHPPKPPSWRQLLLLWNYLAPDIAGNWYASHRDVRIIPVQGHEVLYEASDVVRLGEKKLLNSDDDWNFLSEFLLVLNPNWTRFLTEQRRTTENSAAPASRPNVEPAYAVLKALNLESASSIDSIFARIAKAFFARGKLQITDCVRFAHLAALLRVSPDEHFRFVTRDRSLRATGDNVIADPDGLIEPFLTPAWAQAHLMHDLYNADFTSCSQKDWRSWILSKESRLKGFVPLVETRTGFFGRQALTSHLSPRGYRGSIDARFVTYDYFLKDWSFDEQHWRHWELLSSSDNAFWSRLLQVIFQQPRSYWSDAVSAHAYQVATTGNASRVSDDTIVPAWILKLRELPCLEDTRGFCRRPEELMRRTPETEPLLDVEPFVNGKLDTEGSRALLQLLGVRDKPTGPSGVLSRLRALAQAERPPLLEVEKWYSRLDQMLQSAATNEIAEIVSSFASEKLIWCEAGGWLRANEVFLHADDQDVPDAPVVLKSVCDLSLWRRVGIADRPTVDLALAWLRTLPVRAALPATDLSRVRNLLARFPLRVWNECGHWLNLDAQWVPVAGLKYSLSMASLVAWKGLFAPTKGIVADFQKLNSDTLATAPFCHIPTLASVLEERIVESGVQRFTPVQKDWLSHLGTALKRVIFDSPEDTARNRACATRLQKTQWTECSGLESTPYIHGAPAGPSRKISALWQAHILYVAAGRVSKFATPVALELARHFDNPRIGDALKMCFERDETFIADYIAANFELAPADEVELADDAPPIQTPVPAPTPKPDATPGVGDAPRPEIVVEQDDADDETEDDETEDDDSEEERDDDAIDDTPPHPKPKPKAHDPDLIERFALANGYKRDGGDSFFRADGNRLVKTSGMLFPWQVLSLSGTVLRFLWPKAHCLQSLPLEIGADVWTACEQSPALYSLILRDAGGLPIELTGTEILAMRDREEIVLYPATYRIVHANQTALG